MKNMRVQIVSDLHIERSKQNITLTDFITPVGDILVLAGDIGSMYRLRQLFNFLHQACEHFPLVIYVPGNHEYYKLYKSTPRSFSTLENAMRGFITTHSNMHFLNRKTLQIENTLFVGATLWSNPTNFTNKIVQINGITRERFITRHKLDKEFITKSLEYGKKNNLKTFVVTHYPPVLDAKNPLKNDKYAGLYVNDLDYLLKDADVWVSGHTHFNYQKTKNNCLLVTNQLGKPKDDIKNYSPTMVIQINGKI